MVAQTKTIPDGPAQVYYHPDYLGEVGLIMPYERDFCVSCNRLRVSAKETSFMLVFGEQGIELRDLLQQDSQQQALIDRIQGQLQTKAVSHFLHDGNHNYDASSCVDRWLTSDFVSFDFI